MKVVSRLLRLRLHGQTIPVRTDGILEGRHRPRTHKNEGFGKQGDWKKKGRKGPATATVARGAEEEAGSETHR